VSSTIWGDDIQRWHEGDHLASAAARAGLDLAALDAQVAGNAAHYVAAIKASQCAQRLGGH
jgi:hypothetical protein